LAETQIIKFLIFSTSSLLGPNILLSILFSNALQHGKRQHFTFYSRLYFTQQNMQETI
jgi:hypothetical protein